MSQKFQSIDEYAAFLTVRILETESDLEKRKEAIEKEEDSDTKRAKLELIRFELKRIKSISEVCHHMVNKGWAQRGRKKTREEKKHAEQFKRKQKKRRAK